MSINDASSWAVSILRGGRGLVVRAGSQQPNTPLELYEFESCPYCKKVRETLSELDLEYISRASAKGSEHRNQLAEANEKQQFPILVDPNTGANLYESEDIIDYLHENYGRGRAGLGKWVAPLNTVSAMVASVVRLRGGTAISSRANQPEKHLVLYNFEASPYCRKVREALCELDLDCHVKNVAKKGIRRPELKERGGKMMVPYLIDANTNSEMYESDEIVSYLHATYG